MHIQSLKLKPGYLLRNLGGEFVIAEESDKNGSVNGLPSINETGIFLWEKLEQGATLDELVSLLSNKKNIDLDDAKDDVYEFLAKLIQGNIVEYTK